MFYISEIKNTAPAEYKNELQRMVYSILEKLRIPFERVDTDEAISMDDCISIDKKLDMKMVKTLFLCNRQQTNFYLFITTADKPFKSKDFSNILGVSRLSFVPTELFEKMLSTKVGAATVFSVLLDTKNEIQFVIDKDVVSERWYGCSDGTTTGYMKVETSLIINTFFDSVKRKAIIVNYE